MASLEIRDAGALPWRYDLASSEAIVGRHPDCDVVLGDGTISRRHLRIVERADGHYLEDLGSQHGTWVNGRSVEGTVRLADRDRIQIRNTILVFRLGGTTSFDDVQILESRDARAEVDTCATDTATEKLRALLDLTQNLGGSLDLEEIFPKILESAFRIFPQAARGSIWLAQDEDGEGDLLPQAARDNRGDEWAAPKISKTIAQHVMREGKAILSADAPRDERFDDSKSILVLGMRSVMCAPLLGSSNRPLGMIQLDTHSITEPFSADDLSVLVNLANLAGQAVGHARLHESRLSYERRERDLSLARSVQEQFLPSSAPAIEGYRIAHHYRPAERVGGDYFDYVELPDGCFAVALGDVAGKGVSAALLMARLCSDVRSRLQASAKPDQAMQELDSLVASQSLSGRFVTLVLCVVDPEAHTVRVVNAGHMPPLLRRSGGRLSPIGEHEAGPPLGVVGGTEYEQSVISLEQDDALLVYTDGVSEARSRGGEMFGGDRTATALARGGDAIAILDRLMKDVSTHTDGAVRTDDICAIAISRLPS